MNNNAKKWLEVLESGELIQGKGVLHNEDDNSYCCLGVACELAIKAGLPITTRSDVRYVYNEIRTKQARVTMYSDGKEELYGALPETVKTFLGLEGSLGDATDPMMSSLSALNDSGKTFAEIAAILRENESDYFYE